MTNTKYESFIKPIKSAKTLDELASIEKQYVQEYENGAMNITELAFLDSMAKGRWAVIFEKIAAKG